jgi:hypothetical protein
MSPVSLEDLLSKYGNPSHSTATPVFQDLDQVDWSSARHAYGSASDVPALLRAALSLLQDDRETALMALFGELCHQGSVYEASALAVPFLFRMLEYAGTPDTAAVATLLASLANGTPGTHEEPRFRWVNATREAVGKRLEQLYPYLEHDDPEVRFFMVLALAEFPERHAEYSPSYQESDNV